MDFVDRLTLPENLYWAWGKVRRYYRTTDAWFDGVAVAQFEANLNAELQKIRDQFASKVYSFSPLLPLPQPKKPDKQKQPRARQAFWVSVRDQVAWVAFLNVIGPLLEEHMPTWSYGERLYRPVWFDDSNGRSLLRFGPYRSSPGLLYRRFPHSWPLYRRHIFLTVRQMSLRKYQAEVQLGEPEQRTLEAEELMQEARRLPYLRTGYWRKRARNPHWAGLDLEKFYPSISISAVAANVREYCADARELLGSLLDDLLRFPLDLTGWTKEELAPIDLTPEQTVFRHVPTGLMAAGFLANVAMLKVDALVSERVEAAQVAHFRYVDDHVVLAHTFDALESWIRTYEQILLDQDVGARFNAEKFEPGDLGIYLSDKPDKGSNERRSAMEACRLDPRFPTPLMTKTLAKVSEIGRIDFDLLDEREEDAALHDLEHLLLTPLPDTELPAPTRVTFAATRIASLTAGRQQSVQVLVARERERVRLVDRIRRVSQGLKEHRNDPEAAELLQQELRADRTQLRLLSQDVRQLRSHIQAKERSDRAHVFALLVKAVREYPEKLRLWERVLEFCRVSGHDRLEPLFDELKRQCRVSPTACHVVRARVLQTLATQMVRSAHVLASEEYPPFRRTAARAYLLACLPWAKQLCGVERPKFYENLSANLCRAAAGLVRTIIGSAETEFLTKNDLSRVRRLATKLRSIDWPHVPERWVADSGHSLGAWAWWAETVTQSELSTVPGPIWRYVAPQLDPQDDTAWAVLSRYPAALPDSARKAILAERRKIPQTRLRWLLDFISTMPTRPKPPVKAARVRDLISAIFDPEPNSISLREWCSWTKLREESQPFDPRVGEWTALNLTARIMSTLPVDTPPTLIHWSEFWVPSAWRSDEDLPTWENWRRQMVEGDVVRRAHSGATPAPGSIDRSTGDLEFARVQEIALLLLGLLREDFNWPAAWNILPIQIDSGRVSRALIRQTHSSSWTTAILEACLLPRQRETLLFQLEALSGFRGDDDTTYDPPKIFTRERLVVCWACSAAWR